MHNLKINRWWLIIFVLSFCWACTEDINLDQKYKKKIVVNCVLTTDNVQTLTLTYSNPLNQHYYDEVKTATATLYLGGVKVGQFEKTAYSKWELKYHPKFGGKYRLTVQVPGWNDIEATTTMPFPVQVEKNKEYDTHQKKYFLQRLVSSPYWMFLIDKGRKDPHPVVEYGDKLEHSLGTNHPDCDGFNATDETLFENEGTTKLHIAYLRINTRVENRDKEIPFYLESYFHSCLVFFRAASPEYDQYMKSSVQKMVVYKSFDDPTQWFDENEIYTNISNGLGIFAAYSDRIVQYYHDELPDL